MWSCADHRWLRALIIASTAGLMNAVLPCAGANPPAPPGEPSPQPQETLVSLAGAMEAVPEVFTRAVAADWALRNNPDLAAIRRQHGIAAAAVIIAKTYPFNPIWTSKLFAVPVQADVKNY